MRASILAVLLVGASVSGQAPPPDAGPGPEARPEANARAPQSPRAAAPERPSDPAHMNTRPRAAAEPAPRPSSAIVPAARSAEAPGAQAIATERHMLMAVVREFVAGHRDFWPRGVAPGRHAGIVADYLDRDDKPVFASRGFRVLHPGHDASGEPVIGPRRYIAARPHDRAPQVEFVEGESVVSAHTFNAWFRPSSGENRGRARPVEFRRASHDWNRHAGRQWAYVAEIDITSAADARPARRMNSCTLEMAGRFRYRKGEGDRVRFTAAGDLWVFIDGRLVVDLGGAAESAEKARETGDPETGATQIIDLDRLTWLRSNQTYTIKVFAASRGEDAGLVRIETTVALDGRW